MISYKDKVEMSCNVSHQSNSISSTIKEMIGKEIIKLLGYLFILIINLKTLSAKIFLVDKEQHENTTLQFI